MCVPYSWGLGKLSCGGTLLVCPSGPPLIWFEPIHPLPAVIGGADRQRPRAVERLRHNEPPAEWIRALGFILRLRRCRVICVLQCVGHIGILFLLLSPLLPTIPVCHGRVVPPEKDLNTWGLWWGETCLSQTSTPRGSSHSERDWTFFLRATSSTPPSCENLAKSLTPPDVGTLHCRLCPGLLISLLSGFYLTSVVIFIISFFLFALG